MTSVHIMVAIPGSKFSGCVSFTKEHLRVDPSDFHQIPYTDGLLCVRSDKRKAPP